MVWRANASRQARHWPFFVGVPGMKKIVSRSLRFTFCLRPDERALLEEAAPHHYLRLGAFVREAALQQARRTLDGTNSAGREVAK